MVICTLSYRKDGFSDNFSDGFLAFSTTESAALLDGALLSIAECTDLEALLVAELY
jgi:hypothetical protein